MHRSIHLIVSEWLLPADAGLFGEAGVRDFLCLQLVLENSWPMMPQMQRLYREEKDKVAALSQRLSLVCLTGSQLQGPP